MKIVIGLAVAELDFGHPDHASKAEKSWKLIASTLQCVLQQNVEIRINSTPINASHTKSRRPSFSFFSCSRRMHNKSHSRTDSVGDLSDCSNLTSNKAVIDEKIQRVVTTIRNNDGNSLSTGTCTPHRCSHDGILMSEPHCLSNTRRLNEGLTTSDQAQVVCCKIQQQKQDDIVPSPFHGEASFDAYICSEYPYILRNGSKNDSSDSKHDER